MQPSGMYYISRRKKFISIPALVTHYQTKTLEEHFPLIQTNLKQAVGEGGWAEEIFEAIKNHASRGGRELSLAVGERFVVFKKHEDGWLEAHGPGGERGLVHCSCVRSLETVGGGNSFPTASARPT